jgi:hypothetical protein
MLKVTALATLVAGTLDILFAVILTLLYGREPADMLRSVASGPFPAATEMAASGVVLGLLVHFALMAAMAALFVAIARLRPAILQTPYVAALAYGLIAYFAMNWLIVPLRFGTPLPPRTLSIATQLFAHIVLVGLPFALIARHYLLPRARRI